MTDIELDEFIGIDSRVGVVLKKGKSLKKIFKHEISKRLTSLTPKNQKKIQRFIEINSPELHGECLIALEALSEMTLKHGCIERSVMFRLNRPVCSYCEFLDKKKDAVYFILGLCVGEPL